MQPKNNILQFSQLENKLSTEKSFHNKKKGLTPDLKEHNVMMPEGPLGDLIQYTHQWTNEAISTLFDNVDTQLFEIAEKSESATDQNTYFDAMRIVRLRRNVAHKEFITKVQQSFSVKYLQGEKQTDEVTSDSDNLSLLADDSLEEELAINNMIAKAERDNKDELKQLNYRLSYLYTGLQVNSDNNPMAPSSLCKSFVAAVSLLDAEIKVKLLVYKLFDINIITRLNEFYSQANRLLIDKGVLKNLKISFKGAPNKRTGSTRPSGLPINNPVQDNDYGAQSGLQENEIPVNAGLSQFIQQNTSQQPFSPQRGGANFNQLSDAQTFSLISQLINQNKTGAQQIPQGQYASTDDVMSSLSQMQTNPEFYQNYINYESGVATSNLLKEGLKQSLHSTQNKEVINKNDDDLIDVIGMLFDFILDDNHLVDSVKSLLSRLQIPIIKIALQDKAFFRSKNHPARRLLNDLANAGLGVTDNVTAQNSPLFLKLENLVSRIINEQSQDIENSFFEELLDDLQRFLTQFNQGVSFKGVQKKGPSKNAALELVSTELSSRISNKVLPQNIVLLLERVWKDVMFDIFFSDGMESDEWDMAMTFVDTLIWSVDPKIEIQSQKQLVRVIPGILNALNAGLDRIQYPKELREQLLQDLQNCHLACMKGRDVKESEQSKNGTAYISSNSLQDKAATTLSSEELDVSSDIITKSDLSHLDALDEEELLATLEDGSEEAIADHGEAKLLEDAYTQQARNLTPGAWVEFMGSKGKVFRAKISWMSEDASAYIFVTQTGQIAEKSLSGLSDALRKKQATILDESPVFERAMEAVLEELQEKTES